MQEQQEKEALKKNLKEDITSQFWFTKKTSEENFNDNSK